MVIPSSEDFQGQIVYGEGPVAEVREPPGFLHDISNIICAARLPGQILPQQTDRLLAQPAQHTRLIDVYRFGCDSQRRRHLCDRLLVDCQTTERFESRRLKLLGNPGKEVSQDSPVMFLIPGIQVGIGPLDSVKPVLEVAPPNGSSAAS